MRIVAAPDSFKGSLSALEAARAIEAGLTEAIPGCQVQKIPMADGGEGFVEALLTAAGGELISVEATGPLGAQVNAFYGMLPDGETAVIEMAAASGLPLVAHHQRDPLRATTLGTGELMRHALEHGAKHLIIGIGGSATNDGGAGMAQALGAKLLDEKGRPLPPGGAALSDLARIDCSGLIPQLRQATISVACDVTNPLCGPSGASAVYGPQKGADERMIAQLDRALAHYAGVLKRELGIDVREIPGSGAAGGLGAGLIAFCGATLAPGAELIIDATHMAQSIAKADLVITGEGRTDAQTLFGKVPYAVAQCARPYGVPVVVLSGGLAPGYENLYDEGITAVFSTASGPMPLKAAMEDAQKLMRQAAYNIGRLWACRK